MGMIYIGTKSGINILDYNNVSIWNVGSSQYTTYKIDRGPNNRELATKARQRIFNLSSLLN
jgi:hypothetical protein